MPKCPSAGNPADRPRARYNGPFGPPAKPAPTQLDHYSWYRADVPPKSVRANLLNLVTDHKCEYVDLTTDKEETTTFSFWVVENEDPYNDAPETYRRSFALREDSFTLACGEVNFMGFGCNVAKGTTFSVTYAPKNKGMFTRGELMHCIDDFEQQARNPDISGLKCYLRGWGGHRAFQGLYVETLPDESKVYYPSFGS